MKHFSNGDLHVEINTAIYSVYSLMVLNLQTKYFKKRSNGS